MVTTEVRHKCYCSRLVEWVYGYLFGGKKIWLLNKTQLVQKKHKNMNPGRHGKSKVNRNHRMIEDERFGKKESTSKRATN